MTKAAEFCCVRIVVDIVIIVVVVAIVVVAGVNVSAAHEANESVLKLRTKFEFINTLCCCMHAYGT